MLCLLHRDHHTPLGPVWDLTCQYCVCTVSKWRQRDALKCVLINYLPLLLVHNPRSLTDDSLIACKLPADWQHLLSGEAFDRYSAVTQVRSSNVCIHCFIGDHVTHTSVRDNGFPPQLFLKAAAVWNGLGCFLTRLVCCGLASTPELEGLWMAVVKQDTEKVSKRALFGMSTSSL